MADQAQADPSRRVYLLLRLWHLPELWVVDQVFHRHTHDHVWGYALGTLAWGLATWALGLGLAELYGRRCATRLEHDLDLRR